MHIQVLLGVQVQRAHFFSHFEAVFKRHLKVQKDKLNWFQPSFLSLMGLDCAADDFRNTIYSCLTVVEKLALILHSQGLEVLLQNLHVDVLIISHYYLLIFFVEQHVIYLLGRLRLFIRLIVFFSNLVLFLLFFANYFKPHETIFVLFFRILQVV